MQWVSQNNQIPSANIQIITKLAMAETSSKRTSEILVSGHRKLFGIWDLAIGNF
jgi:hypothetical protein